MNYKRACIQKKIDQSCRAVVVKLQPYQASAQAAIVTARQFVANNQTISALSALNAATTAVATFRSTSLSLGVQ